MCRECREGIGPETVVCFRVCESSSDAGFHGSPETLGFTVKRLGIGCRKTLEDAAFFAPSCEFSIGVYRGKIGVDGAHLDCGGDAELLAEVGLNGLQITGATVLARAGEGPNIPGCIVNKYLNKSFFIGSEDIVWAPPV